MPDAANTDLSDDGVSKFLVVVDDTPECANALYFAMRRAQHVGGTVTMLYIIDPPDFQHWMSVEEVMREEAREEAMEVLRTLAVDAEDKSGIRPELVVREGKASSEILDLINEDNRICFLILAAGDSSEGPGPLVTSFTGSLIHSMPIPVVIVPGHLSLEQIDKIV